MFSHLKRNWLIQSTGGAARTPSSKRPSSTSGHEHDSLIPKKRVKLENVEKVKITLGQNSGKRPLRVPYSGNKAPTLPAKDVPKSLPFVPGTKMGKPKTVKRLLVKRKCTPRVPYYDETDKKALKVRLFIWILIFRNIQILRNFFKWICLTKSFPFLSWCVSYELTGTVTKTVFCFFAKSPEVTFAKTCPITWCPVDRYKIAFKKSVRKKKIKKQLDSYHNMFLGLKVVELYI